MNYHFGLIGYPISYSLSPFIHQAFFNKTELNGEYSIIDIHPNSSFDEAINSLKEMNLDGFNVTIPYKQKIIEYLDEIDQSAKEINAVNTVVNKNGRWIGYNTDGSGYVRSLETSFPEIKKNKGKAILIIGAGGAAKGIYYGLKHAGYYNIFIANRTKEKAVSIVKNDKQVLTLKEAEASLNQYQLIIQTTSVGMKPHQDQSIIHLNHLNKSTIVSDIVYQPMKTKFLSQAEKLGAALHFGHKMLLFQALYAFEIWTGTKPDIEGIEQALTSTLEG